MEQLFTTQVLEKAGLAAVAIALTWVNYKMFTSFNKTIVNHISHSTETQNKLTNAVEKLIALIEKKLE